MSEMLIDEVLAALPQRYPFLMIDKVLDYVVGKELTAIKNVSVNEPYFTGHFPGHPIMPGVMILESLAQASGILAKLSNKTGPDELHLFAGIDKARFKRVVLPGDTMQVHVEVIRVKREICKMKATATVEGDLACSAELLSVTRKIPS